MESSQSKQPEGPQPPAGTEATVPVKAKTTPYLVQVLKATGPDVWEDVEEIDLPERTHRRGAVVPTLLQAALEEMTERNEEVARQKLIGKRARVLSPEAAKVFEVGRKKPPEPVAVELEVREV